MEFFDEKSDQGAGRTNEGAAIICSSDFFELPRDILEKQVRFEMQDLGISETNQERLQKHLAEIEAHNIGTYFHSLRVGILACEISKNIGLEARPLFIAGLLHDYGKIEVSNNTLDKTSRFTEEDYDEVKKHVEDGYELLSDEFSYSAEILVRHHSFGEDPYPRIIPKSRIFKDETIEKIEELARFLSLIDYYDAISSRKNEKFKDKPTTNSEKRDRIIRDHPNQEDFINKLYDLGLFV